MSPLISTEAVAADCAHDKSYVIFDCRFSLLDGDAGRLAYEAGHIPGARFADLERDLSSARGSGGRHPLPDRAALAAKLRAWGVDRNSRIVCYDQNAGALAARLWWLVRWLGHEEVAVLDGGLDAWLAAGLPVSNEPAASAPGDFSAGEPLTRHCTAEECGSGTFTLVDAREAARYRGESEPIDRVAGHIPGAINAPFGDNLADGRFKSPAELAARFTALGLTPEQNLACYCGSGVTAAHDVLALKLAGYPEPALYPGSWSEWIEDPGRPIARA
jgi:thiosulfate/3-mercaptopyruvate sulfurtransferase